MQEMLADSDSETRQVDVSKIVDIFQHSYDDEHEPVGSQHLTFSLGDELYAVDILCVQEIRAWETVTRIPNTAEYIKGVINLRGSILPVIDMRQYFMIDDIEYLETTVVIVISIEIDDREIQVGIVVDMVSDVIRFTEEEINKPPQMGNAKKAEFITGLVTASISGNVIDFMDIVGGEGNERTDDRVIDEKIEKKNEQIKASEPTLSVERMVMLLDTKAIGALIVGSEKCSENRENN